MAINLDSLSPSELQALIKSAEAQMESARKNHVREVRAKIDAVLAGAGLTLSAVLPTGGGKGATESTAAAVRPKYRTPENQAQAWSGRGKQPVWFNQALKKKGVTAEGLLIAGASPNAALAKKAVKAA